MKNVLLHRDEQVLGRTRQLMITNLRVLYVDGEQLSIPLESLREASVERQRKPWILFVAILFISMSLLTGQWALYPFVIGGGLLALTTLGCYCCMKEEVLNLKFSDRSLCVPTEELTTNARKLAKAVETARLKIQLSLVRGGSIQPQAIRISA